MRRLDPDRRAALEEDHDFLLRSLDDLDLELAAGDIDEADHRALKADYVTRAARVIRALEDHESADAAARRPRSVRRMAMWAVAVVGLAAVAGLLVARSSGSRGSGDSISGDIRTTSRELIFEAQQAFAEGDTGRALDLYDDVLEAQPTNVEALTYRGWLTSRVGPGDEAVAFLDDAIALDPDYADARVFRAIVALDLGDADTAEEQMAAFESLEPPPFAQQLTADAQVRERIAAVRVAEQLLGDDPPSLTDTDLTVEDIALAAEFLATGGELLRAVELFDAVLVEDPDNVEALTYRAWLIARAGEPQLLAGGLAMLDQALALDPRYAPALVFRAFARNESGDRAGARADLAAFDELASRPADLVALVDDFGLREAVAG